MLSRRPVGLMLVREIIAVYSLKHTYALCGHNEEPFNFKVSGAYSCHTNIYRVSQEECARLRESVPYVKVYRYNPKHLYQKLNGYGDNGQKKVRSSCGSTYCTFSADALHVLCACRWDWNAVNIMPACPCKVLGTLRTTAALMRVFM